MLYVYYLKEVISKEIFEVAKVLYIQIHIFLQICLMTNITYMKSDMHGALKGKVICSMIMPYSQPQGILLFRVSNLSLKRIQEGGAGHDVIIMGPETATCYLV